MSSHHHIEPAPTVSAIAERLLAHARLCEQIARECSNEDTAEKLRRMARDCALAAAQIAPLSAPNGPTWH
jgi:mannitol/fructose-specific phosphotransferase system IIA component